MTVKCFLKCCDVDTAAFDEVRKQRTSSVLGGVGAQGRVKTPAKQPMMMQPVVEDAHLDVPAVQAAFDKFLDADDLWDILALFEDVLILADVGIDGGPRFFNELQVKLSARKTAA